MPNPAVEEVWPALPFSEWKETAKTLHMWTQVVGKVRLALSPWTNHSWHVTLYLTSRGLTTSPIPHGTQTFEILFDFVDHQLQILTSEGEGSAIQLRPLSVAAFCGAKKCNPCLRKVLLGQGEWPVALQDTPDRDWKE